MMGEGARHPCHARTMPTRPKRSPEVEDQILADLARGYTLRASAGGAGVTHEAVRFWAANDPDFAERLEVAKARGQRVLEEQALDLGIEGPASNVRRHRLGCMDADGWGERRVNVDAGKITLADAAREAAEGPPA